MNYNELRRLGEHNIVLDKKVDEMYKYIDDDNEVAFKHEYDSYNMIRKACERLAHCGFRYPEIEEYANKLGLV